MQAKGDDAAKNALSKLFEGKKDILAANEITENDGGGVDGGGGDDGKGGSGVYAHSYCIACCISLVAERDVSYYPTLSRDEHGSMQAGSTSEHGGKGFMRIWIPTCDFSQHFWFSTCSLSW